MKKMFRSLFVTSLILSVFGLVSCKGFANGESFLDELDQTIAYLNASYADITLNALNSYTESISPATGNYNNKYKAGDSMKLEFVPTSSYQFIKWGATPEDAVTFEDEKSGKTKMTVKKVEEPITVEPVVCARPTVTFLPKNAVAVEKNTSIVITFSQAMNISDEDLSSIQILCNRASALENYSAPVLDETKTVITFDADEENLLSFSGETADITVIIPQDFYYLSGEEKICLEQETSYMFTVNQQTLSKLGVTVSNPDANKGSCNLNGEYSLNIGQIQNLNFAVLQEYAFTNWAVKDADGNTVLPVVYEQFFEIGDVTAATTTVTALKVGSGFVIEPVCVKRAQVVASTPAYSSVGVARSFSIRVIFDQDMSEHSIYWTETEIKDIKASLAANGSTVTYEDYKVANKKSENNENYYYAYVVNGSNKYYKNIEIKKRGTTTSVLNGQYYGCPYFETDSTLVIPTGADEVPEFTDIEFILSRNFVNMNGIEMAREYSGCYRTNGKWDVTGPILKYKAETINKLYSGSSTEVTLSDCVLKAAGKHSFLDTDWSLIPALAGFYTYNENGSDDNSKHVIDEQKKEKQESFTDYDTRSSLISNATTVTELASLNVQYANSVDFSGTTASVEDVSGISDIVLTLTPVPNNLYPNQSNDVYRIIKDFAGETKLLDINMQFDFSSLHDAEGVYELSLTITDVVGNVKEITFGLEGQSERFGYVFDWKSKYEWSILPTSVYCLVDNVNNGTFACVETDTNYNNEKYWVIEGVKGEYIVRDTYGTVITPNNISNYWSNVDVKKINNDGEQVKFFAPRGRPYQTPYVIMRDVLGNLKALAL